MADERLLKPEEIGDNLNLEIEGKYPCSDGSSVWTINVDKLLEAQLAKADKHQESTLIIKGTGHPEERLPLFKADKSSQEVCLECKGEKVIRWTQIDEPIPEDYMDYRLGVGVWMCEKDCPTCQGTGKPKLDRLREKIEAILRSVLEASQRVNLKYLGYDKGYGFELDPFIDQIKALLPDEEEIRKQIVSIITEYSLESASARDDSLERRAKGWELLWQALKGKGLNT